jgi:hypothetical protein
MPCIHIDTLRSKQRRHTGDVGSYSNRGWAGAFLKSF